MQHQQLLELLAQQQEQNKNRNYVKEIQAKLGSDTAFRSKASGGA